MTLGKHSTVEESFICASSPRNPINSFKPIANKQTNVSVIEWDLTLSLLIIKLRSFRLKSLRWPIWSQLSFSFTWFRPFEQQQFMFIVFVDIALFFSFFCHSFIASIEGSQKKKKKECLQYNNVLKSRMCVFVVGGSCFRSLLPIPFYVMDNMKYLSRKKGIFQQLDQIRRNNSKQKRSQDKSNSLMHSLGGTKTEKILSLLRVIHKIYEWKKANSKNFLHAKK